MAKKNKRVNELPLGEDYREAGVEFEYSSDADREAARKKANGSSKAKSKGDSDSS